MSIVQVKELLEAGVHYGHRASRWNPKMRPYIYGKRNMIHIIDLRETVRGLLRGYRYLSQITSKNSLVLFVGTKRQAKEIVERESTRCGMPYVSERWLGGTLTNYRTIRNRLKRLQELESLWLPAGTNSSQMDMVAYINSMMTEAGKLDSSRAPETSQIRTYSKKMISTLNRELTKIRRNLQGIREMNKLPDAIVVVDPKREDIAVKEAQRMGIPTVALIDTDSDPDPVDLPIPGNDDSIRSIEVILAKLADAILEGRAALPADAVQPRRAPRVVEPQQPAAPQEPTAPEAESPVSE
ncbi:30S ribosomal protein S2 [Tuwongella immobilis]|uniref:Small ribosomal subunit protein uS2 n=1 Tax=Tuwongella immobilis TaxID=692036 RepID=A0A6C2YRP5_9BACT|nr:30S ribosomal protein S2 [Tuwongella immobilis]VIP03655.1 30s ribosomal protein s2 : 30S ribosomal protein S2 OS=Singulisphaera acidiphila (strain ATCC BAA-1392 / DSM 18658 / VKM B-2454 / MOB10) GN=rpsB PE=3 SV=1: Ribosomal_S2 [Tuwongella immobilis]VTS04678.1 30s ribosomal protein s2 : 30S ribosomal protein S2 OS=Singulisphaera acidiphila (strain ATCC BAA-1392 / DSM 18658 / VKM B-2454 / MOB10) GN=rpsB PE=3 SV=1: Ribosomal_S2 [Tuwongella immobilis]